MRRASPEGVLRGLRPSRPLCVGAVLAAALLTLVSGSLYGALGERTVFVVVGAAAVGVAALGSDTGVRLAVLMLPFMGLLRRVTGGEAGYVPSDPLILLTVLLLLPAVVRLPPRDGTVAQRALQVFAVVLGLSAAYGIARGASTAAVYALASAGVPLLLGLQLACGRLPGLPAFVVRWLPLTGVAAGLYAVLQWLAPPRWDLAWLTTVAEDFVSVGTPRRGEFRIFGSLEAPGLLAGFMAVCLLVLVTRPATRPLLPTLLVRVPMGGVMVLAMSLTAVRSVLFALPLAVVVGLWARGGLARALALPAVAVGAALLVAVPPLLGNTANAAQRYSLANLGQDESLQARTSLLADFARALLNPVGTGLGSVGGAANLSGTAVVVDNGYLALTIQTGLLGLCAFLLAVVLVLRSAVGRGRDGLTPVWLAVVTFFLFYELSGAVISTTMGIFFWLALGALAARGAGPAPARDERPRHSAARVRSARPHDPPVRTL